MLREETLSYFRKREVRAISLPTLHAPRPPLHHCMCGKCLACGRLGSAHALTVILAIQDVNPAGVIRLKGCSLVCLPPGEDSKHPVSEACNQPSRLVPPAAVCAYCHVEATLAIMT